MGEISQLLQQKVGLSSEQGDAAENAVIEFAKSRVPAEFQSILSSALGTGQAASTDGAPAESGGLGGLLGAAEGFLGR